VGGGGGGGGNSYAGAVVVGGTVVWGGRPYCRTAAGGSTTVDINCRSVPRFAGKFLGVSGG